MGYYDDKYFYYKGKSYTTNTVIKLTQQYRDTHTDRGLQIWKYARFYHKNLARNEYCFNCASGYYPNVKHEDINRSSYCGYFNIKAEELEGAIEEIIQPVPIELVPIVPKKDWEVKSMGMLWLIYIAVLFFSLIFREFYIIWIVATYVFFKIRKETLNQ